MFGNGVEDVYVANDNLQDVLHYLWWGRFEVGGDKTEM